MSPTLLRHLRSVSLILLVATTVLSALAQGSFPSDGQVRAHLQRAQAALQAKDLVSAEKEYRAVLALDPKNAAAHAGIGVLEMGRGNCRAASDEFHSALSAQPSFTRALALLGICQKRLENPSARVSLEKSFQKLQEKPLRVQVGMELVGLYEQQGDTEAVGSLMRQLVELDPENPDILFAAQRIYSDLADDTLTKLAIVAPGSSRMQQAIAEKLINAGDLNGAIDHYRKALQIDPRAPGVHYELGEAILESGRADAGAQAEAQRELESAIAIDGDTAKAECELADIALLQSAPERARTHFQQAYSLNPNEPRAQMGLASLAMQNSPQEAVQYLRQAVQSDPLNGSAHYQLARAYQRIQMPDLAEKELHLSQEIRKTKDQVQALFHEMNRYTKPEANEAPDTNTTQQNQ